MILVSHDRRLIEATAETLLLVTDGKVAPFEGDLDDYRRFLLSGDNRPTRRAEPEAKPKKEEARRDTAEKRKSHRRCVRPPSGGGLRRRRGTRRDHSCVGVVDAVGYEGAPLLVPPLNPLQEPDGLSPCLRASAT